MPDFKYFTNFCLIEDVYKRQEEFEQFIFSAMQEKFKDFQILHGREEKVNPKLTAYQVELAQVEAEIEKLLDTLTGANVIT